MKNNRAGQSTVISAADYIKIRKQLKNSKYKLLLDIAWFSGERWGSIIQLKVDDVYTKNKEVKECITFRAQTRKASPKGIKLTRQVPTSERLKELLNNYPNLDSSQWLFPGRDKNKHICFRACDYALRKACEKAGLGTCGISTHSTRRSLITNLYSNGVGVKTIQHITGHQDIRSLARYIEISESTIKGALELV